MTALSMESSAPEDGLIGSPGLGNHGVTVPSRFGQERIGWAGSRLHAWLLLRPGVTLIFLCFLYQSSFLQLFFCAPLWEFKGHETAPLTTPKSKNHKKPPNQNQNQISGCRNVTPVCKQAPFAVLKFLTSGLILSKSLNYPRCSYIQHLHLFPIPIWTS